MHSRSIEFAKKYGVPIHVRSSFADAPGTWIVDERDARRLGVPVTGAALAKDEARITIRGVPDRPGVVHAIFRTIAAANIVVDMIVQNVSTGGTTEVSFTVAKGDLPETLRAAEAAARDDRRDRASPTTPTSPRSRSSAWACAPTPASPPRCSRRSPTAGINIQMITTSEIKISVLVDRASAVPALRAVHRAFLLDRAQSAQPPSSAVVRAARSEPRAMKLVPLAEDDAEPGAPTGSTEPRPLGMEDLVIAGVELDESQARVALFHVPDRPGYAARVFRAIAEAGVFVDMIVQNVGTDGQFAALVHRAPRRGRPGRPGRPSPPGSARSRSSRPWPSSRSSAWACAPTPASPPGCSPPWPSAASIST